MKNYDLTILNNLSIESLCFYLKQTGWKKNKEREGVASLWKKEGENALIVPLDSSYDDYTDRLWQVFQALEKIEERDYEEIIQSLNLLVNIAKDSKRNILDVVFKSIDGNKKEINAQKMGVFLKNLQNLIDSIAESAQSQENYEFSVLSTYHGSFGIRLATPVEDQKQLDLLQGSETSLEEFIQLIQASSESSNEDEILKEELNHLSQKSIKLFKSFTGSLVELNSNVSFKLGILDKKEDVKADISYVRAANILEVIREKEELQKEFIDVYGKLVLAGTGKSKKERKFIFTETSDESKSYDGVISEDLLIKLEYEIEVGDYYQAKIEKKTLINTVSNSEEIKYRLCELKKIEEEPQIR